MIRNKDTKTRKKIDYLGWEFDKFVGTRRRNLTSPLSRWIKSWKGGTFTTVRYYIPCFQKFQLESGTQLFGPHTRSSTKDSCTRCYVPTRVHLHNFPVYYHDTSRGQLDLLFGRHLPSFSLLLNEERYDSIKRIL